MLYAKVGRKYVPTGKTGADWDLMESTVKPQRSFPDVGSVGTFDWDGKRLTGTVSSHAQCASGCFEITSTEGEVFVVHKDDADFSPGRRRESLTVKNRNSVK